MAYDLPEEEALLEEWAYHCFECGELGKLLNEEVEVVHMKQLERMVKVALWCILDEPSLHPSMKKVLLIRVVDIPIPPSPLSFFSFKLFLQFLSQKSKPKHGLV